jgi:short-subunit dehydrogenase
MNRITVVTGASRGLGVVIAEELAKGGGTLVLAARDEAGLRATAAKVEARGARAVIVPSDVTRPEDRARLRAAAEAEGPVDVLVNNAGVEIPMAVLDQTEADVEQQVRVNLLGPLHLTKAFLPAMVARGQGAIVMISSMSGKSPTPYNAVYAATKHGINGFAASLRIELEGTGVQVGVVCPSFVAEAGMWSNAGVPAPAMFKEVSPRAVARAVRRVLAGKAEVLVTPNPVRPMLALVQLFPALDGAALRFMGVLSALEARAKVAAERRRQ